jgi:hypothetical protein
MNISVINNISVSPEDEIDDDELSDNSESDDFESVRATAPYN